MTSARAGAAMQSQDLTKNWREEDLAEYVRVSFAAGATQADIAASLREAGWSEEQIANALRGPAMPEPGMPAPKLRPQPKPTPWEGLLYLVLFAALFAGAFSLGDLIFSLLDHYFVEPITYTGGFDQAVQSAIARILVAVPVFLFAAHRVGRMLVHDPANRTSPVRRWAIIVALFIAVMFMIGDAATLVTYALRGEIYPRLLLKVATVAAIAGTVFIYFMRDLGRRAETRRSSGWFLNVVFVLACAAAVGVSLTIVEPPWSYREIGQDYRRSASLEALEAGIWEYHDDYGRLPETLDAIDSLWHDELYDPETRETYEYRITGEASYELCATFARAMTEEDRGWVTEFSTHGAGRHCFERSLPTRSVQ
jgi:hypothetical protein